ncbi:MAG: TRAP transporter small permease [Reyranellaceae bacterium]
MQGINRALEALSGALDTIGKVVLLITMLHVTADVVLRYVFNSPLAGTIEISSFYYMIAVVFLPLAAVELRNGHISVEIVAQYLSEASQRILIGFVCLLAAVYYGLLTWRMGAVAIEKWHVGETYASSLDIAIWPPRFLMPLGCGLLVVVLVVKAMRLFAGDSQPLHVAQDEHFEE